MEDIGFCAVAEDDGRYEAMEDIEVYEWVLFASLVALDDSCRDAGVEWEQEEYGTDDECDGRSQCDHDFVYNEEGWEYADDDELTRAFGPARWEAQDNEEQAEVYLDHEAEEDDGRSEALDEPIDSEEAQAWEDEVEEVEVARLAQDERLAALVDEEGRDAGVEWEEEDYGSNNECDGRSQCDDDIWIPA